MPRGVPKNGKRAPKGSAKGKVQKTSTKRQAKSVAAAAEPATSVRQVAVLTEGQNKYELVNRYASLVHGFHALMESAKSNPYMDLLGLNAEIKAHLFLVTKLRQEAFGQTDEELAANDVDAAQDALDEEPAVHTHTPVAPSGVIGTPIAPVGGASFGPPVIQNQANHQ